MAESYLNRQKTLWEKEKLLITSNFSFSHGVFKRLELQTCKNQGLFGKELRLRMLKGHRTSFNSLPQNPDLEQPKRRRFWKTLREKKKMLVTSIFFFSHSVFYSYQRAELSFNPFPNKPWFLRVCGTSSLKTLWEKEKLLVTSNFSFSHSVFYPSGELSVIFIKFEIVVCKFCQFGRL